MKTWEEEHSPVELEGGTAPGSRPPWITLCGGFAKVEHKKYLGPDTIQKGKRIVDYVANIREVRTWNTTSKEYDSVITSTCLREMTLQSIPTTPDLSWTEIVK